MLGRFYRHFGVRIVILLGISLPIFVLLSLQVKSDNDLERWMPQSSPARQEYEVFKKEFGVEEFVLIAFDLHSPTAPDARLIEALCRRLERLPDIRCCWSADRLRAQMKQLSVEEDVAEDRLRRMLINDNSSMTAVVAYLSDAGMKNRPGTVRRVFEQLEYCQLDGRDTFVTGPPLFVAELDRLGSKEANVGYFLVTLGICLTILFYLIRDWKLTGLVFAVTLWSINATSVVIQWAGGEMNFVLSSIPVLVMVLTMAMSVHYLYYYQEAMDEGAADPIQRALELAYWPSIIATVTTCIGEIALSISDIVPIWQFAYASALGSVMALVAGLGVTPALLVICPTMPRRQKEDIARSQRIANWVVAHSRSIVATCAVATVVSCFGLPWLRRDMNVVDFLPDHSKVRQDFLRIERDLTRIDSVEAVVDFGFPDEASFVERLERVRKIEERMRQHPSVDHTLSLGTFFPDPLPQKPLELMMLLKRAQNKEGDNTLASEGMQLWRITVRLRTSKGHLRERVLKELTLEFADQPLKFTGMSTLVENTQREIFTGFWQSVVMALLLTTLTIIVIMRSPASGIVAMLPNIAPLCWVYGALGWLNWPIDIAMMMSGSIALGMSVDGTFHFMSRFRHHLKETGSADEATKGALLESSIPFIQATLTATAGMLGLTLSSFAPTVRFGWLMISLMLMALVGDVLLLPALVRVWYGLTWKGSGKSAGSHRTESIRHAA